MFSGLAAKVTFRGVGPAIPTLTGEPDKMTVGLLVIAAFTP